MIETLAAYAAVALNNARMYENLVTRDRALSQSNKDQSLINDIATSLASTLDVDEILDRTLTRVMDYLSVQAGEIFLREDGDRQLRLALSRGELAKSFLNSGQFQDWRRLYWDCCRERSATHQHRSEQRHAFSAPGSG